MPDRKGSSDRPQQLMTPAEHAEWLEGYRLQAAQRREAAIRAAGEAFARGRAAQALKTPREQAEAAWTPTSPYSVDELEDQIRADRGAPPLDRDGGDADT